MRLLNLFLLVAALAVASGSQATIQAEAVPADVVKPAGTISLAQSSTAAAPTKPFYDPLLMYNPYMWMYWNPYMWMYWNPMMWMYYPYMMWW